MIIRQQPLETDTKKQTYKCVYGKSLTLDVS